MSPRRRDLPPLLTERPRTLVEAVEVVSKGWAEDGALAPATHGRYTANMRRFVRFAAHHGARTLDDLTTEVVEAYVEAPGRDRKGEIVGESVGATRAQRRSAVQTFCLAALGAGWIADDPVRHIPVPRRDRDPIARPLTDDEAEGLRFHAGDNPAGVRATVVALALCGAWASEAGALAIRDVDLSERTVRLPGVAGRHARAVPLDDRAAKTVADRIAWLREKRPREAMLCWRMTPSPALRHAKAAAAIRDALNRAGLIDDPELTPASLTLWAASARLAATGRIEDAAKLLGSPSLDATAKLLRWKWDAEGNG